MRHLIAVFLIKLADRICRHRVPASCWLCGGQGIEIVAERVVGTWDGIAEMSGLITVIPCRECGGVGR